MDAYIKDAIVKLQELHPHILTAVQHYPETLVCTAFLSEDTKEPLVVHEKSFKQDEVNENEAVLAFLHETAFMILTKI